MKETPLIKGVKGWAGVVVAVGVLVNATAWFIGTSFVGKEAFAEHIKEEQDENVSIRAEIRAASAPARAVCYKLNGTPAECEPESVRK
jgi:hypothetical protein